MTLAVEHAVIALMLLFQTAHGSEKCVGDELTFSFGNIDLKQSLCDIGRLFWQEARHRLFNNLAGSNQFWMHAVGESRARVGR
jgi:hypothetical protein